MKNSDQNTFLIILNSYIKWEISPEGKHYKRYCMFPVIISREQEEQIF